MIKTNVQVLSPRLVAHFLVFMYAHMESAICMPKYSDIFNFVLLGPTVLKLGDAVCTFVMNCGRKCFRAALRYITVDDSLTA